MPKYPCHETCPDCGKSYYKTHHARKRCEKCSAARVRRKRNEWKNKRLREERKKIGMPVDRDNPTMTGVHDPRPRAEGGFRSGAEFPVAQVVDMLEMDDYLLPGTVLERGGVQYMLTDEALEERE